MERWKAGDARTGRARGPREDGRRLRDRRPPVGAGAATLYLDTSALVKLFIREEGSASVQAAMAAARSVVTSALTYVEMRAALSRMAGQRRLGREAHEATLRRFTLYWESVATVPVDDALIGRAAQLAEEHALRAYDAVHLASALLTAAKERVTIGAWDRDLNEAARREGLALIDPRPA